MFTKVKEEIESLSSTNVHWEQNENLKPTVETLLRNYINGEPDESKLIVNIDPFHEDVKSSDTQKTDWASFLVKRGMDALEGTKDAHIICAVKVSFLKESNQQLRKQMIDSDVLETVIVLPGFWLGKSKENFALLSLKKCKRKYVTKFIDITYDCGNEEYFNGGCVENLIIHDAFPGMDNLQKCHMYEDQIDDFANYFHELSRVVGCHEIGINNYSLSPSTYIDNIPHVDGYILQELLDSYTKDKQQEVYVKGRIVSLSDLKDSITHNKLSIDSVIRASKKGNYKEFNGKAVLVSKSGALRPTIIDTYGQSLYVPMDEMCIIQEDNSLCLEYVATELYQDYVKKQLRAWHDNHVTYLRIRVPEDTEDKTSLERQKECFTHAIFSDILDYCQRDDMRELLWEMYNNKIRTNKNVPFMVRNIMCDFVLPKLNELRILPIKLNDAKANLNECSKFFGDRNVKDILNIPIYIQRCFHSISEICNNGAHPIETQELIEKEDAPYLNTTLIYELINIIKWCSMLSSNPSEKNERRKDSIKALEACEEWGKFREKVGNVACFDKRKIELAYLS